MKKFGKSSGSEEQLDLAFESFTDSKPARLIRLVLIGLLCCVLVGCMAVFGVGVATHEVEYGSKQVADLIGVVMYQVDSIMMIAVGACGILVTILGLVAVILKHRCLLGLHLVILAFVSITLLVVGLLGYIFITELEDTVERSFEDIIKTKYGTPSHEDITQSWDNVQTTFKCCGAYGEINDTTSWAIYKKHSFWYKDGYANGSYIPDSCCASGDLNLCTGRGGATLNTPPYVGPPVTIDMGGLNYTMYTTGCYDKLHKYLVQNGILIGTTAIVVAIFMILQMVLTIYLHRKMKNLD